jgi:hypothetical protein
MFVENLRFTATQLIESQNMSVHRRTCTSIFVFAILAGDSFFASTSLTTFVLMGIIGEITALPA